MDYTNAMVAGIPIVLVVLGLVEWAKLLGLAGKTLTVVSLVIGLVIGGGYMLTQGIPATFAGWFTVIIYGLGLGLVASKVYDAIGSAVSKK